MTAICPACRYSRLGLHEDAPCPECGKHPSELLRPIDLEPANVRRSLARGSKLTVASFVLRALHLIVIAVYLFQPTLSIWWPLTIGLGIIAILNALAGFMITRRGDRQSRTLLSIVLRTVLVLELVAVLLVGSAAFASRSVSLGILVLVGLAAGWVIRCMLAVALLGDFARRLDTDEFDKALRSWLTYAGIAAMSLVAGVVAAMLTALIPILAPFTALAAVPYAFFLVLLGAIAVVGAFRLHLKLAKELSTAPA